MTVKRRIERKQTWLLMCVTVAILIAGFLYNPSGQFSDIRPFYGMRYWNGEHPWPFSEYLPTGTTSPIPPIEYPALTGLIIWALTFLVPESLNSTMHYFYLSSFIHGLLFMALVLMVKRLTNLRFAYLIAFTPAVITSLNRNWDIWVMLPTLATILLFEKKKYALSSLMLGIAIATKFFPIVLLLPILVFFMRTKEIRNILTYFGVTAATWLTINIPVLAVDASGWSFFYRLSFTRGLGEGSVFTIPSKLGVPIEFNSIIYYLLNIGIFAALVILLWKNPRTIPLLQSAFLVITAFTLFGKQYSMQYVLWLAPLAVIAIWNTSKKSHAKLVGGYIFWQIFELLFHQAYYQNLLARVLESRGTPLTEYWSDFEYGLSALFRYGAFLVFLGLYINVLVRDGYRSEREHRPKVSSAKKK